MNDGSGFARDFAAPELLCAVRRALRDGGVLACNVIGTLAKDDPVAAFVASARSVFEDVRILPVVTPDEHFSREALRNVVVVALRV